MPCRVMAARTTPGPETPTFIAHPLRRPVKRSCHERLSSGAFANDELDAAKRVLTRARYAVSFIVPHHCDSVHIYSGFRRRNVHRGAYALCLAEHCRYGSYKPPVGFCHALVHKCGEPPMKLTTAAAVVERLRNGRVVALGQAAATMDIGLRISLFITGTPYPFSIAPPTSTRRSALCYLIADFPAHLRYFGRAVR